MPNIEIHGMDADRAERVKKKIFTVTASCPWASELVVTTYQNVVVDRKNNRLPFFRVYFDRVNESLSTDDIEMIGEVLGPFDVDIEMVELSVFVPRVNWNQNPDDRLERAAIPNYEDT